MANAQTEVQAPAIVGMAVPRTTYYRFYTRRKPKLGDDRQLFSGAKYVAVRPNGADDWVSGLAVGPATMQVEDRIIVRDGAIVIPAIAVARKGKAVTPKVRPFTVPNTGMVMQFIDALSLRQEKDGTIVAIRAEEPGICQLEVNSGDTSEDPRTWMIAQAGMHDHGSIEWVGGGESFVAAANKKGPKKKKQGEAEVEATAEAEVEAKAEEPEEGVRVSTSHAELKRVIPGTIVKGTALWETKIYNIHFTREQSEFVLIWDDGHYWMAYVKNGEEMVYHDVTRRKDIISQLAGRKLTLIQKPQGLALPSTTVVAPTAAEIERFGGTPLNA